MDRLRERQDSLPKYFYRVQYSGTQTTAGPPPRGFCAAGPTTPYREDDLNGFRAAVERQYTWLNRFATCFISVFSDRDHAKNWANMFKDRETSVWAIDTSQLKDVYVFSLRRLVAELGVNIPEGARNQIKAGYMCLNEIPFKAVEQRILSWECK
jgi:hypothetical protein